MEELFLRRFGKIQSKISLIQLMREGESLSVYDAALIWASNGKDEDYSFGYSEEELEDVL